MESNATSWTAGRIEPGEAIITNPAEPVLASAYQPGIRGDHSGYVAEARKNTWACHSLSGGHASVNFVIHRHI